MAQRLLIFHGMTTIVAVDIHRRSAGALRFAQWLSAPEPLRCVHVLRESYIRHAVAYRSLQEVQSEARRAIAQFVQEVLGLPLPDIQLIHAEDVSQALRELQATGEILILGRFAERDRHSPVRLGSVVRRTLRNARGTTIVVPPDLLQVASGPVVVATSCDEESARALAFARELAERKGREVLAVHTVEVPEYLEGHYLSSEALSALDAEIYDQSMRRLSVWGTEHKLTPESLHLLRGELVSRTITFAEERQAALLVAAPRQRNILDRILVGSVSAELASRARCAVALVV